MEYVQSLLSLGCGVGPQVPILPQIILNHLPEVRLRSQFSCRQIASPVKNFQRFVERCVLQSLVDLGSHGRLYDWIWRLVDVVENIGMELLDRLELILHLFVVEQILQELIPRQETLLIKLVQLMLLRDLDLVSLRRHLLLIVGVLTILASNRSQLLSIERLQEAHQIAEIVQL